MKAYDIKTLKCAALLRGYLLERDLPDEVRAAADHLTGEIETILTDVNQIVEAELAREEREREQKRAAREAKREEGVHGPTNQPVIVVKEIPETSPAAKQRKPWSPEAREAAAARMRNMQAAKKAKRSAPGEAQAPSKGGA